MKIKLLATTAMVGLFVAGCNLNLPKLPEINKGVSGSCSSYKNNEQKLVCYNKLSRQRHLTEKECEDQKKTLSIVGGLGRDYFEEAGMLQDWCERKYTGVDIDIEAIMEKNK